MYTQSLGTKKIYIYMLSVAILAQAYGKFQYYSGNITSFCHGDAHCLLQVVIYALFLVCCIVDTMPHSRSAASRSLRTQRALFYGYAPSCRGHRTAIVVPTVVCKATTAACQSLYFHWEHDVLSQAQHHYGHHASAWAFSGGWISEAEFNSASAIRKMAGKLKHNISKYSSRKAWADHDDNDDNDTTFAWQLPATPLAPTDDSDDFWKY